MPIPDLTENGLLPPGIHDCSLEEVDERFGQMQVSTRRMTLTKQLRDYCAEVTRTGQAVAILVDGSYVTAKDEPGDIDLVLVLSPDANLEEEVPPFVYNARSKRMVKRNFEFDFFFAWEGDAAYKRYLYLFTHCKEATDIEKGILRVTIPTAASND